MQKPSRLVAQKLLDAQTVYVPVFLQSATVVQLCCWQVPLVQA
jgi:hypothetical protein